MGGGGLIHFRSRQVCGFSFADIGLVVEEGGVLAVVDLRLLVKLEKKCWMLTYVNGKAKSFPFLGLGPG
jgi:hypothetical protein